MSTTSPQTKKRRRKNNNNNNPPLIQIIGSANQDLTSYTSIIPKMGETVLGTSFGTSFGGKGANQAVAAASVLNMTGMVEMVCRVGDDLFGRGLLENFDRVGVIYNKQKTTIPQKHTGVAPIIVDETNSGQNMIIVIPGANHALTPSDLSSISPKVILTQLEILPETSLEALKVGKTGGSLTILNPSPVPKDGWVKDWDGLVDVIVPNEVELRHLCRGWMDHKDKKMTTPQEKEEEELAKLLFEKGRINKAVIVTLGPRGALVVTRPSSSFSIQRVKASDDLPFHNDPVIDTVGAGDAFCGSLAAYLSVGMEVEEAAIKACGVAGMSVRRRGAQDSYVGWDDLPEQLRVDLGGDDDDDVEEEGKAMITFVTGNEKKLEEVKRILRVSEDPNMHRFHLQNQKIDLPELQGSSPQEIAIEKCKLAASHLRTTKSAVITEDTSLCFNALHGLPGPYIKWFLDKCGHDGLNRMLSGYTDKTAYAQTVVGFTVSGDQEEVHLFEGRTEGRIVQARGRLDFGWDPIFEPLGMEKTYAEMEKDEKDEISHRGKAFAGLRSFLIQRGGEVEQAILEKITDE